MYGTLTIAYYLMQNQKELGGNEEKKGKNQIQHSQFKSNLL